VKKGIREALKLTDSMTFCYNLDGIANIQTKKYPQSSNLEGRN